MHASGECHETIADGPSDATLILAARGGSRAAFGSLVERHYGPLLRALTWLAGDPDLAADLTQDTFIEAQRCLVRVDEDRPFGAWLYGIARNLTRRAQRSRRVRHALSLDWLRARGGEAIPALRRGDQSDAHAERELLQQVLDDLSPLLREALLLHSLWGYTNREIARIVHISPAAAQQRITRAYTLCRQRYAALERGGR